jgi:hypothetical protein
VEVQRLIAHHRAEIAAVQEQGAADAARRADEQRAQHEADVRQLRERLAKVCWWAHLDRGLPLRWLKMLAVGNRQSDSQCQGFA